MHTRFAQFLPYHNDLVDQYNGQFGEKTQNMFPVDRYQMIFAIYEELYLIHPEDVSDDVYTLINQLCSPEVEEIADSYKDLFLVFANMVTEPAKNLLTCHAYQILSEQFGENLEYKTDINRYFMLSNIASYAWEEGVSVYKMPSLINPDIAEGLLGNFEQLRDPYDAECLARCFIAHC